ncbi:S8 family peptidase [Paenibacillus soyae]|uniref:S8 family peptidase n=1 Tax=Paenibacillus soyae TaxID=2969249 RepID=A0A9X2MNX5_9BACL|nr:S8 family peptidase [Paenibacillus soyae]MCR2803163.1 S8 family peptidase [Paenibacillus soyae]
MRKSWITAFTVLTLAALLIPGTRLLAPDREARNEDEYPRTAPFSAESEQKQKFTALQNDMTATALLMNSETKKDFRNVLARSGRSDSKALAEIDALMGEHSHIGYIGWQSEGIQRHRGEMPESPDNAAQSYAREASAHIANGQAYESPAFEASNGSRYVVLGVPSQTDKGTGVVGFVKQDIVKRVEQHQKQNLRLIPYPAEGNYRIESVKPNSTVDTTVRTGEDNGNASHYHIRDVVVHIDHVLTDNEMNKIKSDINMESVQQLGDNYIFRSKTLETKQLMDYFKKNWKPRFAEPNYLYLTNDEATGASAIVPNDALYSEYQWNLPSIEAEKGWAVSKGDEGVIIAVLDTGVQLNHPDLQGKLVEGTNIVDEAAKPNDDVGHGTHVSGIIGASVNNGEGVAGVSWFNKIMPVKVLDSSGAGSTYAVAQGIIWAVDHGAKVINMSLGNYAEADFLHDAIKYAYERDVVLIAASGNDNTERPGYPAAYPEVFAVAATNNNKEKASFSNYGDYIDVAAPGDSIASTYPGSQYAALSGTSMASPHVAALAGLIRSVNPDLNNEEVMEIMRSSARDLGTEGKDKYFGYGEIDVIQALSTASNYSGALQTYPQQVKRKLERLK